MVPTRSATAQARSAAHLSFDLVAVCVTIPVGSCGPSNSQGPTSNAEAVPSSGAICQNRSKSVTLPRGYYGYSCPRLVNRTNWRNKFTEAEKDFRFFTQPIYAYTSEYPDVSLSVSLNMTGNKTGWNMDLQFECCRWEGKEVQFEWTYDNYGGEHMDLLSPARRDLVRIDEPYLSTAAGDAMKDAMSALYSGALFTPLDWTAFVGNCRNETRGPSWTWSFWARVISFGSSSGLVVLAKTYQDEVTQANRTSWRIMLYQNGNFGLEGTDFDVAVREAAAFARCALPSRQRIRTSDPIEG
jgi:hypothetical protein